MAQNCPNCGAEQPKRLYKAAVAACEYCSTTLILDGERLASEGSSGILHDAAQLVKIGQRFRLRRGEFEVLGHAQMSYGRGFWDEYWVKPIGSKTDDGPFWLSVDEGDVALQWPLAFAERKKLPDVRKWNVGEYTLINGLKFFLTERETATCLGFEGAWPEPIRVGGKYHYVNADCDDGRLLSGEFDDADTQSDVDWFMGKWFTAFDFAGGVR